MELCRHWQNNHSQTTATTQQLLAAQRARYASLSFAHEQRRLRIHLRRILLVHGDASIEPSKQQHRQHVVPLDQLKQWKAAAITRDQQRHRRHTSAVAIQTRVRRWLARRYEHELPCSSEFVAFSAEQNGFRAVVDHEKPERALPMAGWAAELQPTRSRTINKPFQVIVELLGARDLAFPRGFNADGRADVVADLRLVHESTTHTTLLGRVETSSLPASSDGIQWEYAVLQLGIDPETLDVARVLAECVVTAAVFVRKEDDDSTVLLGKLSVAMDLLETPLADKYAMTRWFPLERSSGGGRHPARGEVRMSIRFLMRKEATTTREADNEDGDGDVWVPYAGSVPPVVVEELQPPSPPPVTKRASARRRPGPRMNKGLPTTTATTSTTTTASATATTVAGKPPLSPRKKSPLQVKTRVAAPVPYRKVEVISPPSSPSSYSSDSNASPQKSYSPAARLPLRRQVTGGIVATAAARRSSVRASVMMATAFQPVANKEEDNCKSPTTKDNQETREASPKKPFLKRKPYKVVFQKLDWSRVGSKTDSGSGAKGVASPVRAATQAAPANGSNKGAKTISTGAYQGMERLMAVVEVVQAACHVTTQTAPLAQMKYKAERKRLLATLAPTHRDHAVQPTISALDVDEMLQSLWTELHGDANGAVYADRLAALLL